MRYLILMMKFVYIYKLCVYILYVCYVYVSIIQLLVPMEKFCVDIINFLQLLRIIDFVSVGWWYSFESIIWSGGFPEDADESRNSFNATRSAQLVVALWNFFDYVLPYPLPRWDRQKSFISIRKYFYLLLFIYCFFNLEMIVSSLYTVFIIIIKKIRCFSHGR